jgi:hypothetical protein
MILKGSKNYPGVFRLKKFSMKYKKIHAGKFPHRLRHTEKTDDLKADLSW